MKLPEAPANGKFLSVMKGSSVFVYLRRLAPATAITPPGDPRLWQALRATVGDVSASRGVLLGVVWPEGALLPTPEFFEQALGVKGLYEIKVESIARRLALVVRPKGALANPLVLLIREWLDLKGFSAPREAWSGKFYELSTARGAEDDGNLSEAATRLLTLGERSGVYSPESEEARIFLSGQAPEWPLETGEAESLRESSLTQRLIESCAAGEHALIRRGFSVKEIRPRTPATVTDLKPALQDILWSWNSISDPAALGCLSSPPLHFLVGAPARVDAPNWAYEARVECEHASVFYDRPLGSMALRQMSTTLPVIDVCSPLPIAHQALPLKADPKRGVLYAIGPWDARNPLVERRIEAFVAKRLRDFPTRGEVIEGQQDWVVRFSELLAPLGGWSFDERGLREVLTANLSRNRHHRLGLFWDEEGLSALASTWGIPIHRVGVANNEDLIFVGKTPIPRNGLLWKTEGVEDASWAYPEFKSPTYGYEKATLFPDRFLVKVATQESSQPEWHTQLWLSSGGDRLRSAPHRNELSTSLDGFRWTDGESMWAEASGFKHGWSDVDPRQAGIASVDAAVRALIALGAQPGEAGVASVWITHPDNPSSPEEGRERLGAYLLATQGVSQALRAYKFSVSSFDVFAAPYSTPRPEIRVFLRAKLSPNASQVVPGFRMSGEMLYAVGPRPAFMDAGSHLLSHVKVTSNHLSKISLSAQAELYQQIWALLQKGTITSVRPIGEGGIAGAAAEMALWGGMGAQLRPNLPTIELFSGAPGRFLVGVLPSEAKAFEALIKNELLTAVGATGTEKVLGLPLDQLREARRTKAPA